MNIYREARRRLVYGHKAKATPTSEQRCGEAGLSALPAGPTSQRRQPPTCLAGLVHTTMAWAAIRLIRLARHRNRLGEERPRQDPIWTERERASRGGGHRKLVWHLRTPRQNRACRVVRRPTLKRASVSGAASWLWGAAFVWQSTVEHEPTSQMEGCARLARQMGSAPLQG